MIDMEALADILVECLVPSQIEEILQHITDCRPHGNCPICDAEDVPVDEQGKEIDGDDVSMAFEFQERHAEDCIVTWIEKNLERNANLV